MRTRRCWAEWRESGWHHYDGTKYLVPRQNFVPLFVLALMVRPVKIYQGGKPTTIQITLPLRHQSNATSE